MTTPEPGNGGLARRSITAMLWGTGGSILRIALQVVSQIILARVLGPELFGLFAVALVVVLLSGIFADVGLAYGLIQKPIVSSEDVRFVFTWQLLLGIVMAFGVWLASPWIANLYGDPRLAGVIAALAPSCLISSAAATSGALLRREMDFKTINIAAVTSYAVGFFVFGVPMALMGFGTMSLVAAFLSQTTLLAAMQYARVRHDVRPLLWQAGAPGILGFGLTVLATNLVNWAMSSIDRAIVGSWLGLAAAGLYSTAYNLVSTPLVTALSLMQSVFYSASAKVQDEPEQMRKGLRTLFGAVTLFVAPVFAGVAAAAETIILTLYGSKWGGGGAVLAPLALAMPAYLMMGLATPVLWASGATRKEFQLQIPIAALWIAILWVVAQFGSLPVLGWAVCLLFQVRAAIIVGATLKSVVMPAAHLAEACRAGLVVTASVGLAGFATDRVFGPLLGRGASLLMLDVAACAGAFLIGLGLVRGAIGEDLVNLLRQVAGRVPGGAGDKLLRLVIGRG